MTGKRELYGALGCCFCLSISFCGSLGASDTVGNSALVDPLTVYVDERSRFIDARKALAAGDSATFESLLESLSDYPLHDYLAYERLIEDWSDTAPTIAAMDQLREFAAKTQNSNLTRKLTRSLQARFAEQQNWAAFQSISQSADAASMDCAGLRARSELGQLSGFDAQSLALWVVPKKHPKVCSVVLEKLEKNHTPPVAAIWERIFNAMEADKPEFASPMLGYLASADRALVKRWLESTSDPSVFLTSGALSKDTVLNRRILTDLVVEWSRQDTPAAMAHWLSVRDDYVFFRDRYYGTNRAIAMRAAYRRLPQANEWLNVFEARDDDLELKEWRIRTAMLAEDWPAVRASIAQLPPEEQAEDHWAYWEARALEELGRGSEARPIYARLAELQSYHGFLSADRLGTEYSIYDEPIEPDPALLDKLAREPALVRAREYHFVELAHEGRGEWNSWLRNRSSEELAAAAVLASHWTLHDRSIYTAGQADQKRAISLRFPVLYRTEVAGAAAQHGIEPAWILGVMRRESAYIRDIRSGAGAIGLMQLMPNTARYVANLQGTKNWRGDLTDSATNIDFGTFYLRYVMNKFNDHQVLATASYNAGPHRIDKWLGESTFPADLWIDTIPFTETRRYVRAVLAYAAIYEYHLAGKAQRLSTKLLPIPAASKV